MKIGTKPLLGLCPIGKFVFSHEDALRQKRVLQKRPPFRPAPGFQS